MRYACPPHGFDGRWALYEGLFMGRTVLPFSRVLEQEVQEWREFRRGLRKEDQEFLDRLFEEARLHVQAGVYASRPWPFETILISILLEHEKTLVELRSKLRALEEKSETDLPILPSPLTGEGEPAHR
jgi:hypothetical protein